MEGNSHLTEAKTAVSVAYALSAHSDLFASLIAFNSMPTIVSSSEAVFDRYYLPKPNHPRFLGASSVLAPSADD